MNQCPAVTVRTAVSYSAHTVSVVADRPAISRFCVVAPASFGGTERPLASAPRTSRSDHVPVGVHAYLL